MMIFALSGVVYFLGNILLAWATLQRPYLSKTRSSPPLQNKNDWVHSVIFEPQSENAINKIILQNNIICRFPTLFTRFSIHG